MGKKNGVTDEVKVEPTLINFLFEILLTSRLNINALTHRDQ